MRGKRKSPPIPLWDGELRVATQLAAIETTARSAIRGAPLRLDAGMLGKRNDRRCRRIPTHTGSLKGRCEITFFLERICLDWDYYTAVDEENQVKSRKTLQKI